MFRLLLPVTLIVCSQATSLKIVTIGDSLTDGYDEVAQLAGNPLTEDLVGDKVYPVPDPPSTNLRAFNWPELLSIFRPAEANFGPTGAWPGDLRFGGFQRNFAVVGTTTGNWYQLLTTTLFNSPSDSFPANFLYLPTQDQLFAEIDQADVVVIMLGGNDLKNDYSAIFNAPNPGIYLNPLRARLDLIHGLIREQNTTVPIVVATVPDVGATPSIYQIYNVEAKQQATRAAIASMNAAIVSTFEAKPNTSVARIDRLTDMVFDLSPFHLNGTEFTVEGDPFNPPDHLFCKDDFHPATAAQALIANEIMAAINELYPGAMTPFSYREILEDVLLLDPDQPYIDWAAGYGLGPDSFDLDSDGDGLPNGVEMLLDSPPNALNQPFTGTWKPGSMLEWSVSATAERYIDWNAEESSDLDEWTVIPPARFELNGGIATASPAAGTRGFVRIVANPKP